MSTGLQRRTFIGWIEEPDERAPVRSTDTNAERFSATSQGGASFDTTISTALTGATAASYVGQILRCTAATNTQNVHCDVEILAFNAGTDTLTHTAFPARTESGDQFEIFLPPDPICVETTGGANTITASARNEADYTPRGGAATDYWIGDYMVVRYAAVETQGTKGVIASFVAATGAFNHTAFAGGVGVGDLCYLRRYPKTWGPPELAWGREDIEHLAQTSTFSRDPSVFGTKTCSATVTLPLKGSGSAAGDGVVGVAPPELTPPLACMFSRTQSTGEALTGGSVSVPEVTNGTLAQFPVGTWVMDSAGRMAVVTATNADGANPDEITVNPPLNRAPIAAEILYGGYGFEPMLTGHKTMTIDAFVGGTTNVKMYGCMPSIKLTDFGRGMLPKAVFEFQGNYWVETNYPQPSGLSPTFDTVLPFDAKDAYVYLVVTGSTTNVRLVLKTAEVDFGFQFADEPGVTLPDGVYGRRVIDMQPRITMTMQHDTSSPISSFAELLRYMGGQTFSLMLQHGRARGNAVGVYAHRCKWLSPTHSVADGLREIQLTAEVLGSNLTTMPDISLGFC